MSGCKFKYKGGNKSTKKYHDINHILLVNSYLPPTI